MRTIRSLLAAIAAASILTTGLPFPWLSTLAGADDVEQVVRTGQVVEIRDTTITIRQDAGRYTYRLSPTGRQALEWVGIRVGDSVRVSTYAPWEIAYDLAKI